MKPFFALIYFLLLPAAGAFAQSSEAWIKYDQPYFKVPVAQDGIYRLSYLSLQQSGFPVDAVDPSLIQIFHRGIEHAIYVEGEADSHFDSSDFLEFFGTRNDGTLDEGLYETGAQPHRYYNLFSDTTSYFLTIGTSPGKRMQLISELNTGNLPPAANVGNEAMLIANEQYGIGINVNNELSSSSFETGEGWTGFLIAQGGQRDYTVTGVELPQTTAAVPKLEVMLVARNGAAVHHAEVYIGVSMRLLRTVSFAGFSTYLLQEDIAWSDLTPDGKLAVRVRVLNSGYPDHLSLSYARISYPQKTDAALKNTFAFYVPENANGRTYLELANPPANCRLFDVTDPGSVKRITSSTAGTLNAVIPFADRRKLLATAVAMSPRLKRVTFRPLVSGAQDFVVISHPALRKPVGQYNDPVKAYGAYRASEEGGGYDTLILNMPMLYDQFSYGEPSPLAIINLLKYLSQSGPPKYLFLVGKGLEVWNSYYRSPGGVFQDFVPTSGYPGSDMRFSAGLSGSGETNAISTGRISATTPAHVAAYLDKIIELESGEADDLWRKNIMHLSGGIEIGEPEAFRSILEEFAVIAEGPYLGGKVEAVAKQSREVQVINIAEQVNKGVGLVTFFGHSSSSTLDFDIGFASDAQMGYANKGKYPMLLMNGCEAGAFFLKAHLFGEDWINTRDKGASAFIAHSSFGLVPALRGYSMKLYEVGYGDSLFVGRGIGDIQKEAARRYLAENENGLTERSQVQQMILLGDPAVKLFGETKPDLEINPENVTIKSFDDALVTIKSDSFAIELIVRNFGIASKKSFRIEVTRTLDDNTVIVYDSIYKIPRYSDTLTFIVRQQPGVGGGNNAFSISLDPDEIIDELNELNNSVRFDYAVPSNGTRNLYPYPFAIVNSRDTRLSFQSTDVFSGVRNFIVELDTSAGFNSPFKQVFSPSGDVIVSVPVSLPAYDTMAYFWRTRLAQPLAGESEEWNTTSFTYIENGDEGWAQVHISQLSEDPAVGLIASEELRRIHFRETTTAVDVLTFGANAGKPRDSVSVKIDGQEYNLYTQAGGGFGCRDNTINLIAFDRNSTTPYVGIYFKWYEILFTYGGRRLVCGREPFVINSFTPAEVNTGGNDDLLFYVDQVASGDSVLLYNIGDAGINAWPAAARAKLADLGISEGQLSAISAGAPFVIFGKKGSTPGSAKVFTTDVLPANSGRLEVNETVTGRFSSGSLSTTVVGPAMTWDRLTWKIAELEATDEVSFDITGIALNGSTTPLLDNAVGDQDLSFIDPQQFPYLRVRFNVKDDELLTATQLRHWIVSYTPAPEGILLPVSKDRRYIVNEGEKWSGDFRFINISDKHFSDSLTVNIGAVNQQRHSSVRNTFRIKQPGPADTTTFAVQLNTLGAGGENDVTLSVNPRVLPELYYDNNIFQQSGYLFVREDGRSPVMEVAVDGRRLINGDFVSSSPLIEITLRDRSAYVFKTDTIGMRIFLQSPCAIEPCDFDYIPLSNKDIVWTPASATSPFAIEWRPGGLISGDYRLKVEGADAFGKPLSTPYEVTFSVADNSSIGIIEPYPNPTTRDVSFGFVAAGDELPSAMTFNVIDVAGKNIMQMSIPGARFHTGTNTFLWSPAARSGSSLPAGMYIFTIAIKVNGKAIVRQGKLFVQ